MASALVIVDPLNGFLKKGALAMPEHMEQVPYIVNLIESDVYSKIMILKDDHDEDDVELRHMPNHCMHDSYESDIVSEVMDAIKLSDYRNYDNMDFVEEEAKNYEIFTKNAYSPRAGYGAYLDSLEYLRDLYDEVHIVGFVSSICVYNAVQDFANTGFDVVVHQRGIADVGYLQGGIPEKALLNHWRKVYNVEVVE